MPDTKAKLFDTLAVSRSGVLLNGHPVNWVTSIDVKNINLDGPMEVTMRFEAGQVDICYPNISSEAKIAIDGKKLTEAVLGAIRDKPEDRP